MRRTSGLASITKLMRGTFGLDAFRPGQRNVIASIVGGHDTVAVMPTGSGKSLCYQLPALHLPGTTVVVSPLIALMKDQADKLADLGVSARTINSTIPAAAMRGAIEAITAGTVDFVFVTPERLEDAEFLRVLTSIDIDLFVVDEAHCLSEWGHDFRPAFLSLHAAIAAVKRPPVLALTATATDRVLADIVKQLGLRDPTIVNMGVYRPNLRYAVEHTATELKKQRTLIERLRGIDGTGIVYVATVTHCGEVARLLETEGLAVGTYHGRMAAKARHATQDRFMSGGLKAIVATNAFGMGIDKPDIRFVIHYDLPGSIEAYSQESGRAGRDGDPADCVLLYRIEDRRTQQFFMGGKYPGHDALASIATALQHAGAAGIPAAIDRVQELANVPKTKVRSALTMMKDAGLVRELRGGRFRLLAADIDAGRLEGVAQAYAARQDADREKLERITHYAQSAQCRWRLLLDYFGEGEGFDRCGVCDNCVTPMEARLRTS